MGLCVQEESNQVIPKLLFKWSEAKQNILLNTINNAILHISLVPYKVTKVPFKVTKVPC